MHRVPVFAQVSERWSRWMSFWTIQSYSFRFSWLRCTLAETDKIMSGQAGIFYFDQRPIDHALADRLGAGLADQGPDGGSEHFGPGLLMVYRAFNFDPLSRGERQPYRSANGNWITFDGRLDNREDLVLLAGDYLREDKTDVALALAAYEKWGEPGLNRLLGDWSVPSLASEK